MKTRALTPILWILLILSGCGDDLAEPFRPVEDFEPHSTLNAPLNCVVDESTPVATLNMYDQIVGEGYCAFGYNTVGWPVCRQVNKKHACWFDSKPYPGDVGLIAECPSSVSVKNDCFASAGKTVQRPVNY